MQKKFYILCKILMASGKEGAHAFYFLSQPLLGVTA